MKLPGSEKKSSNRKKVSDEVLIESYSRLNNIWKVGTEVGLCGQSVQERLVKLGIQRNNPLFTDDEKFFLLEHYNNYLLEGKLQELADKMGRTKQFICRKAKQFGLTDISRRKKLLANYKPQKPDWTKRPHPRGMFGKKHTKETLERISEINKINQQKISSNQDKRADIIKRMIETKHARGNLVNPRPHTTWKSGWREIGGKRKYFRSKWEANYARYLELLKEQKQIKEWQHEAKVFWFSGIKRGCVSFLPDFEITELSDKKVYHEVKGWMDDRSKTKIRRMGIYYPETVLRIIDATWFKANNRKLMPIIKDWE